MDENSPKKVVIIGGGFGGIAVAKKLSKLRNIEVTLITKNPLFEYYPALYKLVTGALAIEVCVPYNKIFKASDNITVLEGFYESYDKNSKIVTLLDGRTFSYDYLVLAMGSQTNYFDIQGIEEFAFAFKSSFEALRLKQHFLDLLRASQDISKEELVERFHVTVVGGGPSGVELAGDITTYLRKMTKRYHVSPSFVTIDLIESNARVLAMLPESVSKKAEARLRKLKVNIYTNRTLQAQDLDSVTASGMTIKSGTVIWTAGTKINDSFSPLPLDAKKRVSVKEDLSLPDDKNVFVVGDGAGAPGSGLAQGAIAHGEYVAKAIALRLKNKKPEPFKLKPTGYIVPIGHNWAVLSYKNMTISGFIPWIMRSFVDFKYFTSIVPFSYVLEVFRQGKKYRKGEC
ncbi:MAG TPA: NAD(P)/FAD-dependent oxidoreductase [Candidatus Paceibacterota bacterium]|nr:NAD(P)/FAD-dependent oxidoreductase [Candidatus Paceibacterota bacterium]